MFSRQTNEVKHIVTVLCACASRETPTAPGSARRSDGGCADQVLRSATCVISRAEKFRQPRSIAFQVSNKLHAEKEATARVKLESVPSR